MLEKLAENVKARRKTDAHERCSEQTSLSGVLWPFGHQVRITADVACFCLQLLSAFECFRTAFALLSHTLRAQRSLEVIASRNVHAAGADEYSSRDFHESWSFSSHRRRKELSLPASQSIFERWTWRTCHRRHLNLLKFASKLIQIQCVSMSSLVSKMRYTRYRDGEGAL